MKFIHPSIHSTFILSIQCHCPSSGQHYIHKMYKLKTSTPSTAQSGQRSQMVQSRNKIKLNSQQSTQKERKNPANRKQRKHLAKSRLTWGLYWKQPVCKDPTRRYIKRELPFRVLPASWAYQVRIQDRVFFLWLLQAMGFSLREAALLAGVKDFSLQAGLC